MRDLRRPAVLASVGCIVTGVVLVIGVYLLGAADFQSGFLSNFLATLGGLLFGVPVALWLASRQARDQREDAERAERTTAQRRRREVLAAIRQELDENRTKLTRDRRDAANDRTFAVPFPTDEVWSAMSDGGHLQWVDDLGLLRRLARAYVFIRTIIYLEKQAFEVIHYPGTRAVLEDEWGSGPQSRLPADRIKGYLIHQDERCIAAIDEALELVDANLEND